MPGNKVLKNKNRSRQQKCCFARLLFLGVFYSPRYWISLSVLANFKGHVKKKNKINPKTDTHFFLFIKNTKQIINPYLPLLFLYFSYTHTQINKMSFLSSFFFIYFVLLDFIASLAKNSGEHLTASLEVFPLTEKTIIAERLDISTNVLLIKHRALL